MMRCISNVLVVLILVGIVMVCTMVAGIISSAIMQQQVPRGSSVSVSRALWYSATASQGYVYIFELTILNTGTEKANITNVTVTIGGSRYIVAENVGVVGPNKWIQVVGSVNAEVSPVYTIIPIEISFCSESGICGKVVASARPA
ncbi:MAG: hypothetical protein QXH21_08225 [Ignisphaera sp.]